MSAKARLPAPKKLTEAAPRAIRVPSSSAGRLPPTATKQNSMKLLFQPFRRHLLPLARLQSSDSLPANRNPGFMNYFLRLSGVLFSIVASSVFAGDVTDCTEAALLAAFDGEPVTFLEDCSITLTAPITIDSDTTIDAQGHRVMLSGDN